MKYIAFCDDFMTNEISFLCILNILSWIHGDPLQDLYPNNKMLKGEILIVFS